MPDHIHMLVSIPPKYSVSQFVGYLKGQSALNGNVKASAFRRWPVTAPYRGEQTTRFTGGHDFRCITNCSAKYPTL